MAADPTSPPYWMSRAERSKTVILYSCDKCGAVKKNITDVKRIELILINASGGEGSAHREAEAMWCSFCVRMHLNDIKKQFTGPAG